MLFGLSQNHSTCSTLKISVYCLCLASFSLVSPSLVEYNHLISDFYFFYNFKGAI